MMWTHCLQRQDDRCPGLFNPWLTGSVSMWSRSVGASLNSVIVRRQGAADAVAWLRWNGCWVKLEVVCSW